MSRLLFFFAFLLIIPSVYSQKVSCKSYPMGGYRGDCELTSALSADRKYLYTSDRATLKKWDIESNRVVEEIRNFTHELTGEVLGQRFLKIEKESRYAQKPFETLYDLKLKRMADSPETSLLNLLSGERRTAVEKLLKANTFWIYFSSDSSFVGLADGEGKTSQLEVSTGKIKFLFGDAMLDFNQEANTFTVLGPKEKRYWIDLVSGQKKEFKFKSSQRFDRVSVTPDKKYMVYDARFIDRNTGEEVFHHDWTDRVYFKSDDPSMFYAINMMDISPVRFRAFRFTYPGFKPLSENEEDVKWYYSRQKDLHFDPDRSVLFTVTGGFDIKTKEVKVPFSVEYKQTADDLKAEAVLRERNAKIGNDAMEKLSTMKTPSFIHVTDEFSRPKITNVSDNGKIVTYGKCGDGASVIVWAFPEGTSTAYRDRRSTEYGMSESAILVPGVIKWASISSGGKVIGISTDEGVLFYDGMNGAVQKSQFLKREVISYTDNYALLGEQRKSNVFHYKDVIVVNPHTGETVCKVKLKETRGAEEVSHPGKFTFYAPDKIGILDPAVSCEINYTPIAQLPENDRSRYNFGDYTVTDVVTGKGGIIDGLRPFTSFDKSVIQTNYMIIHYVHEGYYVYDMQKRKLVNEKPIYLGWQTTSMPVYFPGLNKLLVWTQVPVFTSPNATDQDPGASSFTVDVATGEIIPYLTGDPRSVYLQKDKAAKAEAFRYASLPCEEKTRSLQKGDNLASTDGQEPAIVLGFDCDINAYVIAKRSLLSPGTNSTVQVSRLFAVTEEEMRGLRYINIKKKYEVCPVCHGYPLSFSKQTTSGWSEWEQKSINIYVYTRKWETKTEEIGTRCSRCKGEAWVKVD